MYQDYFRLKEDVREVEIIHRVLEEAVRNISRTGQNRVKQEER